MVAMRPGLDACRSSEQHISIGSCYNLTSYIRLADPSPADHGFQYFVGAGWPSAYTLTQDIDVSPGASIISGGNVKYTVSGFLGSASPNDYAGTAQLDVSFKNAGGQTFSSATLGPLSYTFDGMSLQQAVGLVPSGTVRITVTLSLKGINGGLGAADSLSLVLATLGTSPGTVLGTNLIVNSGVETGPAVAPSLGPSLAVTAYVPGWSPLPVKIKRQSPLRRNQMDSDYGSWASGSGREPAMRRGQRLHRLSGHRRIGGGLGD